MGFFTAMRRWKRIWRAFKHHIQRHRPAFFKGATAAIFVVLFDLLMPIPLQMMLEPLLSDSMLGSAEQSSAVVSWMPFAKHSSLFWAAIFCAFVVALGISEFFQRLWVARFAIAWVRDIRAESFHAAKAIDPRTINITTGDMVARLIGDVARLKAGLKGFLTHVATKGMLFFGVSIIFFFIYPPVGVLCAAMAVTLLVITWYGSYRVYLRYRELRRKEGKLANRIESAISIQSTDGTFARVNYSSGVHEASVVKLQGYTVFFAHLTLGIGTLSMLLASVSGNTSGAIGSDAVLLVLLYALRLYAPGVSLARQGTRIGKMMACGDRLERLLREGKRGREAAPIKKFSKRIKLKDVSVTIQKKTRTAQRLVQVDLIIEKGERVAVLGESGSGKTTLLELLAAQIAPTTGKVFWGKERYKKTPYISLRKHIAYLSSNPFWLRKRLSKMFPVSSDIEISEREVAIKVSGAAAVLDSFDSGYDSKVGSDDLSAHEARIMAIAHVLLNLKPLVLLDDPFESASLSRTRAIQKFLSRKRNKTIVVSMTRPKNLDWFDKVVVLRRGKIIFSGTPRGWQIRSGAGDDA
ncbi:MAG: ABC transporter ATP-binding protein [Planctomycetes bacterium]|nr:ABC transporter ATP-binding protein [Planctomycetota bacterium]